MEGLTIAHSMSNETRHHPAIFNQLGDTMRDPAYLPLVAEEAAEVIQAIMKIQRFGADDKYRTGPHKGQTTVEALAEDIPST